MAFAKIADFVLKLLDRVYQMLRTSQARSQAHVGPRSRVLRTGEVINIGRSRDALRIGAHCAIAGQILVFPHGGRIRIGDYVFVGDKSHIWSAAEITIGDRVLISHGVEIHDTESHSIDAASRAVHTMQILDEGHPADLHDVRSKPIHIGSDVWIGFGATIRKGVTIGDRAIIGARAIVGRDIPADAIVRVASTY